MRSLSDTTLLQAIAGAVSAPSGGLNPVLSAIGANETNEGIDFTGMGVPEPGEDVRSGMQVTNIGAAAIAGNVHGEADLRGGYISVADDNGKPQFAGFNIGSQAHGLHVHWTGTQWRIFDTATNKGFYSDEDVDSPELVEGPWLAISNNAPSTLVVQPLNAGIVALYNAGFTAINFDDE